MLRAVVTTHSSGAVEVAVSGVVAAEGEEGEEIPEGACERTDLPGNPITTDCPELNPIAPELKEVVWGFGAFVVLAVVLRYVLFPKLREGMRQRYESIQADKASAETLTGAARADVAAYEAQLVAVRAEAQARDRRRPGDARGRAHERPRRGQRPHRRAAGELPRPRSKRRGPQRWAMSRARFATSAARAVELATGRPASTGCDRASRASRRWDRRWRHELPRHHPGRRRCTASLAAEEPLPNDGVGTTSINPILAPMKEVICGGIAIADRVRPASTSSPGRRSRQAMKTGRPRIQNDLDDLRGGSGEGRTRRGEIRTALGDIDGERRRLFADRRRRGRGAAHRLAGSAWSRSWSTSKPVPMPTSPQRRAG